MNDVDLGDRSLLAHYVLAHDFAILRSEFVGLFRGFERVFCFFVLSKASVFFFVALFLQQTALMS